MVEFDATLRIGKRAANLLTLEDQLVEEAGEVDRGLVVHVLTGLNAHDVLHAKVVEHLTAECRGAGRQIDEVELTRFLLDQGFQIFLLYPKALTSRCFEEQCLLWRSETMT